MASVFLAAELTGRQKRGGPALFFTAAVMAGFNPQVILDISFQLSFLSMYGLIYVYPFLGEAVKNAASKMPGTAGRPAMLYIFDNLAISLSAIAAIWPLLVLYFGALSTAGPLATVLAAPMLPLIIVLSLAMAVTGLVLLGPALVIGAILWLLTSYLLVIAGVFARLPQFSPGSPGAPVILGYYAALVIIIWGLGRVKYNKFVAGLSAP
jgi:competence protein ComEC